MISLIVSQWDVDFGQVLRCELAAYPPSLFHSNKSMRLATGKACLKKCFGVQTSARIWGEPSFIEVDVSAVLWTIHWPSQGTVLTFVESFKTWIANHLSSAEVHQILDRYYDFSHKEQYKSSPHWQSRKLDSTNWLQSPLFHLGMLFLSVLQTKFSWTT